MTFSSVLPFSPGVIPASDQGNADAVWYQQAAARQIRSEHFVRAELLNGRAAMLGFVIAALTEALTGHGILGQLGLS
ncbi:MAG: high light inducible protein [Aphanocapsa feldmannii 277cV]|uniref:High light inducible protein n=2 Tax=Aphanocapsa feldmannii TaxID=192050 RepID=A0A524RQW5_9CHRO|nr:MAG: high light inducible protein [Aphanocapsa feldmannii 277cV]TGH22106.1 MAG: high light inducible protein [Aphanocapsa feldmannii 277cI]